MAGIADVPFRETLAREPRVEATRRATGEWILRDPTPLEPHDWTLVDRLRHWSDVAPERTALAQRGPDGEWIRLSYATVRQQADAIGQGLLDRGVSYGQRAMILSGNSLAHGAMMMACMTIGVSVSPISPHYSLMSEDFARLRTVHETIQPAVIFVEDGQQFARALEAIPTEGCVIVAGSNPLPGHVSLEQLLATTPAASLDEAFARVGGYTVAKVMFTSGSTGSPKGVINTHSMLSSNVTMADQVVGWPKDGPPDTVVTWLPWNHTMSGNSIFNINLHHGGSYYIDDGLPVPGAYDKILRNLRELNVRNIWEVPASYALLVDALEADRELADFFFSTLEYALYAGASLPDPIMQKFQALAIRSTGKRVPFFTGFGATETSPGLIQLYWPTETSGTIGLPMPGVEAKLVPLEDGRYDIRVKGPNITPGYLGDNQATTDAFDEEGYYRMGDAVRFVDEDQPILGLNYAGRLAEDFKLLTGTFVTVGAVRLALVDALAPLAKDAVITGHDKSYVGAMIWPQIDTCRELLGSEADGLDAQGIVRHERIRAAIADMVQAYNAVYPASSTRIARFALLADPPSVDDGEITDKGNVNQKKALVLRADVVAAIHSDPPGPDTLVCSRKKVSG